MKKRVTWWHMRCARGYELDGFIVKQSEMQRMVKGKWTMSDGALSDHRPVCLQVNVRYIRVRRRENDRE